ncbi:hypothetical protein ACTXT7_004762 [Hymenolepis weldensis]
MPILRRTSSSSRLLYFKRRCRNCNDNGHKEDFYRESSTNSSTRQNQNNKRALTQRRQSYDRHWLRYLMLCNSTYRCNARLHSWRRRSSRGATFQIVLRRSLAVLVQSTPAAEFRGQGLRTACEEMLLSNQLCVPTTFDPTRSYRVDDLLYALNHNLNHQWTAAIITKPHGGDIYDVENGKDT